jgi:hypothetical protein
MWLTPIWTLRPIPLLYGGVHIGPVGLRRSLWVLWLPPLAFCRSLNAGLLFMASTVPTSAAPVASSADGTAPSAPRVRTRSAAATNAPTLARRMFLRASMVRARVWARLGSGSGLGLGLGFVLGLEG